MQVRTASRFRSEYEEVSCSAIHVLLNSGMGQVKTIARNSNAEVCQCRKRFDGALYAVKKVSKSSVECMSDNAAQVGVNSATEINQARAEVFALAALSHRNILRYFDSWHEPGIGQDPGCLFIVTELCVRPLSRSLGLIPEPPMTERVVRSILHQLLEVHSQ